MFFVAIQSGIVPVRVLALKSLVFFVQLFNLQLPQGNDEESESARNVELTGDEAGISSNRLGSFHTKELSLTYDV